MQKSRMFFREGYVKGLKKAQKIISSMIQERVDPGDFEQNDVRHDIALLVSGISEEVFEDGKTYYLFPDDRTRDQEDFKNKVFEYLVNNTDIAKEIDEMWYDGEVHDAIRYLFKSCPDVIKSIATTIDGDLLDSKERHTYKEVEDWMENHDVDWDFYEETKEPNWGLGDFVVYVRDLDKWLRTWEYSPRGDVRCYQMVKYYDSYEDIPDKFKLN